MFTRFHIGLCIAASLVGGGVAGAQERQRVGDEVPIYIDSTGRSDVGAESTPTGMRFTLEHPGATYLALHFQQLDLAPGDRIILSRPDGGDRHELTGRGKMDASTFWAPHVKGSTLVIDLVSAQGHRGRGRGFVVDRYAAGFVPLGGPEAICGTDDKKNAVCYQTTYPTEYGKARAVARLLIQGWSLCTGWLASASNHLVTNNHCITSAADALNTDYEFMAEAPTCTSSNCQLCYAGTVFSGANLVRTNVDLDYSLVQITAGNPAATYGFLEIDNRKAVVGERIYIPQHAGGRAKEIGIASTDPADTTGFCRVSTITAAGCSSTLYSDVGYQCDTEGGSSGSPVLAANHKVIALHHCASCPNRGVPIDLVCAEICGYLGGGTGGNTPPAASFTNTCTGLACSFTDTSTDTDGTVVGWSWSFGDGTTSTLRSPSHAYAAGGSYTVQLTVTDDGGATGGTSRAVTVTGIQLSARGYKVKGQARTDLTWSGAPGTSVDVLRNGTKIITTPNDGAHTDVLGKLIGTYRYKVCAAATTNCSNEASVTF